MKVFAQIFVAFAPVLLAGAIPFIRVVRSGSAWRAFFLCRGFLVFWVAFFSLGIPLICSGISRELAHGVSSWVPEGSAIVAIAFFGWFYAGITVLAAGIISGFRRNQANAHDT